MSSLLTVMLELPGWLAQAQPNQLSNPLMDRVGERAAYIGVILLAIAIAFALGVLNRRLDIAILISLALSAFLIVLLLVA